MGGVLWFIGNVVLLVVVAPVVIYMLNRVRRPILEIRSYADDILEHGVALTNALDSVSKLSRTRDLASQARSAGSRYASALSRIL